jgi:hypothetical protein
MELAISCLKEICGSISKRVVFYKDREDRVEGD